MITVEQLQSRLQNALNAQVKVTDDSHRHVGHAGAKSGGKHFSVTVISAKFEGLPTLAQHRLVYDALSDWMNKEIHALAITTKTSK